MSTTNNVKEIVAEILYKIWAKGVVGRGKSFLLELMRRFVNKNQRDEKEQFQSGSSPSSFTSKIKEIIIQNPPNFTHPVSLVDGPGQGDLDEKVEEAEHQKAMNEIDKNNGLNSFMFVISGNMRLSDSDREAYHRLPTCLNVKSSSIVMVVNREPEFKTASEETEYRYALMEVLKEEKMNYQSIVFIKDIKNIESKEACQAAIDLWSALSKCQSEQHKIIKERETKERLQKEKEIKEKEQNELKKQMLLEQERQRMVAAEQTERLRIQQQNEQIAHQQRLAAEEKARQDAIAAQLKAQQEQQAAAARAQAVADAQPVPVRCESGGDAHQRNNPCVRTMNFTAKQVRDSIAATGFPPYFCCKNLGYDEHFPKCRGH